MLSAQKRGALGRMARSSVCRDFTMLLFSFSLGLVAPVIQSDAQRYPSTWCNDMSSWPYLRKCRPSTNGAQWWTELIDGPNMHLAVRPGH